MTYSHTRHRIVQMWRDYLLLGCTLFSIACATSGAHAKAASAKPPVLSDADITNAIESEILADRAVPLNEIGVETADGIVTLTGTVTNIMAKERAEKIAQTIKGVRSLINRIKVEPTIELSDRALEQRIGDALFYDRATDSYEIIVTADQGVATLNGTVDSYAERDLVGQVAKGVNGVRAVKNNVVVKYKANRPADQISSDVTERLRWDALVDGRRIEVQVSPDSGVTLKGTVGSVAEKWRAARDAWVAGVHSVNADGLKVKSWAKDTNRRDSYVQASDEDILAAVREALQLDPRADSYEIRVGVHDGIVTLRGTVDSVEAKNAAEQVARATTGVAVVHDRIRINTVPPSDAELEQKVSAALNRDPYLVPYSISVTADDGVVSLGGSVDSYFEKAVADSVAGRARGVKRIKNKLSVDNKRYPLLYEPYVTDVFPYHYEWYLFEPVPSVKSDSVIRDEIKDELWWSPFVDANNVDVEVQRGTATLKGHVQSYAAMRAAVENAFEGGASWVHNEIRVGD